MITYPERTESLTLQSAVDAAIERAEKAEAEVERLKQFERIVRRLWFFFADLIPAEWRDETMARWMKTAQKEG